MFQRLDDAAARAVDRAWQRARLMGLPAMESEHLLMAVAEDPGTAAGRALNAAGLTADRLARLLEAERSRALRSAGVEPPDLPRDAVQDPGPVRYGTSAKNALRRAVDAARARRSPAIDPTELVRGILGQEAGTVPRLLALAGANQDAILSGLAGRGRR